MVTLPSDMNACHSLIHINRQAVAGGHLWHVYKHQSAPLTTHTHTHCKWEIRQIGKSIEGAKWEQYTTERLYVMEKQQWNVANVHTIKIIIYYSFETIWEWILVYNTNWIMFKCRLTWTTFYWTMVDNVVMVGCCPILSRCWSIVDDNGKRVSVDALYKLISDQLYYDDER